jgi:thaumarchaeosortase
MSRARSTNLRDLLTLAVKGESDTTRARGRVPGIVFTTPYLAYFALLVLIAFLADPSSFTHTWNQGRSAMLAIVPLVFLEGGRASLEPLRDKKPLVAWLTLGAAATYYVAFAQPFAFGAIVAFGRGLGVDPSIVQYSWVWGIDYAVTSVFLAVLLFLDRGSRTITPLIYTVGMASFLFIDVLLPENTLGPFGYVVPPVLSAVAGTLDLFSPNAAQSQGNILTLHNSLGSMRLQVFWPSAGLDGIVIGLLVVLAICVKTGTGWARGAFYMGIGVLGSFLVNVLRLVLLAAFAMDNITDPQAFDSFHSVIGELIFIPWIVIFVVLIIRREKRMAAHSRLVPALA